MGVGIPDEQVTQKLFIHGFSVTHPVVEGSSTNAETSHLFLRTGVEKGSRMLHLTLINGSDIKVVDAVYDALLAVSTEQTLHVGPFLQ